MDDDKILEEFIIEYFPELKVNKLTNKEKQSIRGTILFTLYKLTREFNVLKSELVKALRR